MLPESLNFLHLELILLTRYIYTYLIYRSIVVMENCKFVILGHSKISELFSIWYSWCISSVSYLIFEQDAHMSWTLDVGRIFFLLVSIVPAIFVSISHFMLELEVFTARKCWCIGFEDHRFSGISFSYIT
jgi:hypothetical protein